MTEKQVKLGIYEHFKGNIYEVRYVAKDADTLEEMVVYVDINQPSKVWVRSKQNFLSPKVIDGVEHERFKLLMERST